MVMGGILRGPFPRSGLVRGLGGLPGRRMAPLEVEPEAEAEIKRDRMIPVVTGEALRRDDVPGGAGLGVEGEPVDEREFDAR